MPMELDDHHRNDHDPYDLNGRIKWPGEKQTVNNMDHLENECDSQQKCIRVPAASFFQPIKEPMIPWMIAESTQAYRDPAQRSGYLTVAAITVVIKPETDRPETADRTPITLSTGSALSPGSRCNQR